MIKGLYRVVFLLAFISCNQHSSELKDNHKTEGRYYRYFDPFLFKPLEVLDENSLTYPYFEILNDSAGECIGFNFHFKVGEVYSDLLKAKGIELNDKTTVSEYLFDKSDNIKTAISYVSGHGLGTITLLTSDSVCVQRKTLKLQDSKPLFIFLKYYYKDSIITFGPKDKEFDGEIDFIMPKYDTNVFEYVRYHYFTKKDGRLEVRTVEKSKNKSKTFYSYFPAKDYDSFTIFLLEGFEYRFRD